MIAERSVVLGESSSAASTNDSQAHHQYRLHHAIGVLACGANTNLRANSGRAYIPMFKLRISHACTRALIEPAGSQYLIVYCLWA